MTLTHKEIMSTLGKISQLTGDASKDLRISDDPMIKTSIQTEKQTEAKNKALESAKLFYWLVKETGFASSIDPFTKEYVQDNYKEIFPPVKEEEGNP